MDEDQDEENNEEEEELYDQEEEDEEGQEDDQPKPEIIPINVNPSFSAQIQYSSIVRQTQQLCHSTNTILAKLKHPKQPILQQPIEQPINLNNQQIPKQKPNNDIDYQQFKIAKSKAILTKQIQGQNDQELIEEFKLFLKFKEFQTFKSNQEQSLSKSNNDLDIKSRFSQEQNHVKQISQKIISPNFIENEQDLKKQINQEIKLNNTAPIQQNKINISGSQKNIDHENNKKVENQTVFSNDMKKIQDFYKRQNKRVIGEKEALKSKGHVSLEMTNTGKFSSNKFLRPIDQQAINKAKADLFQ